jgi:RNA polymerase sigma-70 factor (ECF subfamily)
MQAALDQAYRQYFPLLVRKCSRMLRDPHEAQDVAQESFVRFHREGLSSEEPRAVAAWLYRTSTRLVIDRLRARRRTVLSEDAFSNVIGGTSPESQSAAQELLAELVERVSENELSAALLARVDGLSQAEIGEVLGVHERTVRRLLSAFDERVDPLRTRSRS